ncbi:MAG: hypothetical protein ACYTF3_02265 [Planctomycetota bacterium]
MSNRAHDNEAQVSMEALFADEKSVVDELFQPSPRRPKPGRPPRPRRERAPKPTHYKVVSISLYMEDIERLEALVAALKSRGESRANKSLVIREALRQLDVDAVPPQR